MSTPFDGGEGLVPRQYVPPMGQSPERPMNPPQQVPLSPQWQGHPQPHSQYQQSWQGHPQSEWQGHPQYGQPGPRAPRQFPHNPKLLFGLAAIVAVVVLIAVAVSGGKDALSKDDLERQLSGFEYASGGAVATCQGGLPARVGARQACIFKGGNKGTETVVVDVTEVKDGIPVWDVVSDSDLKGEANASAAPPPDPEPFSKSELEEKVKESVVFATSSITVTCGGGLPARVEATQTCVVKGGSDPTNVTIKVTSISDGKISWCFWGVHSIVPGTKESCSVANMLPVS